MVKIDMKRQIYTIRLPVIIARVFNIKDKDKFRFILKSRFVEKEGIKTTGLIYSGRPYEAIIEAAKEKKADLIVVGSHGKAALARLLMGSVTERVIGTAECAVLVVKAK